MGWLLIMLHHSTYGAAERTLDEELLTPYCTLFCSLAPSKDRHAITLTHTAPADRPRHPFVVRTLPEPSAALTEVKPGASGCAALLPRHVSVERQVPQRHQKVGAPALAWDRVGKTGYEGMLAVSNFLTSSIIAYLQVCLKYLVEQAV